MDELPPIVSVDDVAEYFKVCRSTVFKAMKSGKLKYYKFGRQRRIKREWVMEFEASMITEAN
ncbi:helix-turn-helix domain-containing protein [Paenibacillus puldeungensis]|uniref:Helix-turn-helix domain-containing protein n=1 Tax=Paenibacillus puldeungensis TaxID=696536 RepID=A0ABW3S4M0_9BACL